MDDELRQRGLVDESELGLSWPMWHGWVYVFGFPMSPKCFAEVWQFQDGEDFDERLRAVELSTFEQLVMQDIAWLPDF